MENEHLIKILIYNQIKVNLLIEKLNINTVQDRGKFYKKRVR